MVSWTVGFLVFDGVAALDAVGPLEVFSRARLEPGVESRRSDEQALFDVFTVARTADRDGDVRAAMEQWVVTLEGAVRRWPTQWYTFYDFWPQPSGPA